MNKQTFKVVPIKIAICPESENPIFGEQTTTISIDDEGAGPFIVIEQYPNRQTNKISFDIKELVVVMEEATKLFDNYNEQIKDKKTEIS